MECGLLGVDSYRCFSCSETWKAQRCKVCPKKELVRLPFKEKKHLPASEPSRLLYRYRPLMVFERKTVVEELKNQELYFSTTPEKNDPMDGLQIVFWEGDEVLWRNLIRHYCMCILEFYLKVPSPPNLSEESIDARAIPRDFQTPFQDCLNQLVRDVFQQNEISILLRILVRKGRLYQDELASILAVFHSIFLLRLNIACRDCFGLEMASEIAAALSSQSPNTKIEDILSHLESDQIEEYFETLQSMSEQVLLGATFNNRNAAGNNKMPSNWMRLLVMFPSYYVSASARCIYPESASCSFSSANDDSALWAYYADNHRGICLVFESGGEPEAPFLEIRKEQRLQLLTVRCDQNAPQFNFFRGIAYLKLQEVEQFWLKDDLGESELLSSYRSFDSNHYWAAYKEKISYKMADWRHEMEVRALQYPFGYDSLVAESKLLRYNFDSLKGIVFGLRTPEEIQLDILEAVRLKLAESDRTDFDFYKAKYSRSENRIKIRRLSLLSFHREAESAQHPQ